MPIITDIKSQKQLGRVSIYVDGTFFTGLSDWQLLDMGLKIGQELDSEAAQKLKAMRDIGRLYDRTLNWLAIRRRSTWELRSYLKRKTKDAQHIEFVERRLLEKGLVDDEVFAQAWVDNRRATKLTSKRKLELELRTKRVAPEIISKVLAEDEGDDNAVLVELIHKKRRMSRYQDNQKLMQYLSRQGFHYGQIKQALEEADAD